MCYFWGLGLHLTPKNWLLIKMKSNLYVFVNRNIVL